MAPQNWLGQNLPAMDIGRVILLLEGVINQRRIGYAAQVRKGFESPGGASDGAPERNSEILAEVRRSSRPQFLANLEQKLSGASPKPYGSVAASIIWLPLFWFC